MANINELINRLAKDGAAVKPAPHPLVLSLVWTAFAVVYIGVSLMISGSRPDLMLKLQEPLFAAEIATLAGVFIATCLSSALLSFPDLHQMRRVVYAPAIAFVLFVLAMFFAWQADSPPTQLPAHNMECTFMITLVAILPATWTFYVMRKYASTHQYWAGSTALLSAFSVGALWFRLYEPTDSIMHVIQWHYLPMIAIGLIGLGLGKMLLKW